MGLFSKEKKDGRKNRQNHNNKENDKKFNFSSVEPKTRHGILAIVSFLVAFFFILASAGWAGKAGTISYDSLKYLFGFGFFILPALAILLGLSFSRENRPHFATTTTSGGILFFLSSLGLVSAISGEPNGGIIGGFVTAPLLSYFDIYFTVILLSGLFFISTLLIFSAGLPKFSFDLFRKKKDEVTPGPALPPEVHLFSDQNNEGKNEKNTPEKKDDKNKKKDDIGYSFYALRRGIYAPPPLSLLEEENAKPLYGDIKANSNLIKRTLANFGVEVEIDDVSIGPSVARYAIKPAEGVRLAKIVALQDNLALALAAHPLRIEAPIPGKSLVGIEIPNKKKAIVSLRSLLSMSEFRDTRFPLSIALGQGVTGTPYYADLGRAPHILIAGATGSGKSVAIHSLIISLLYRNSPDMLRFIMIDPKRVELTAYNKIPHLVTPVITDAKKAIKALNWAISEMERRYGIFESLGVRDIDSYHKNIVGRADNKKINAGEGPEALPFIVIIVDELADIMHLYPRELEGGIVRLAQKSRAVGIHLVLSTQRPSVNVVTGLIKANVPSRVALQVNSQVDSRTILDQSGAEKLLGQGDMLYQGSDMAKPVRLQSPFVSEGEIRKVAKYLADSYDSLPSDSVNMEKADPALATIDLDSMPDRTSGSDEEDKFIDEAQAIVMETGRASTSFLQRRLGLGYSRAAKIMDQLESRGVVGPANGAKIREVYGGQKSAEGQDIDSSETAEEEVF
jgi:S-DNA-T family DNA segregation ATPase FtsK/SpoIIIE